MTLDGVHLFGTGGSNEVCERWVQRVSRERLTIRCYLPRLNTSILLKSTHPIGSLNLWLTSSRATLSSRRYFWDVSAFFMEAGAFPFRLLDCESGCCRCVLRVGDVLATSMPSNLLTTTGGEDSFFFQTQRDSRLLYISILLRAPRCCLRTPSRYSSSSKCGLEENPIA